MTDYQRARKELISFLVSISRPGRPMDEVDDNANLFDAGLIDSLAVIQIIQYLEQHYGINLQSSGINPSDLSSVGGIVAAIGRAAQ